MTNYKVEHCETKIDNLVIMNKLKQLIIFLCVVVLASLITSCGLIDMDIDDIQIAYDMRLDYDTIYVIEGDSVVLHPVFTPDSVTNREVFFSSANEEVAYINNNTIVAANEGETVVSAISVMNEKMAFCQVYVMAPWVINIHDYSDDMVAYVTASVDGNPLDLENQIIGAFVGSDLRGLGQLIELNDNKILQFRIYGHFEWGTDEPTRPELVRFVCYDKEKMMLKYLSLNILFDGETHGSPSAPLELTSSK